MSYYNVLKPSYVRAPEVKRESAPMWNVDAWVVLGVAADMTDAKLRFGGAPILQYVKSPA